MRIDPSQRDRETPAGQVRRIVLAGRTIEYRLIRARRRSIGMEVHLDGLTVRAPKGARIVIVCRGKGCPTRRSASTAALQRFRTFERTLRAGVRLTIVVSKPGFVGKWAAIVIRRGQAPLRSDRCVAPGARTPERCPA